MHPCTNSFHVACPAASTTGLSPSTPGAFHLWVLFCLGLFLFCLPGGIGLGTLIGLEFNAALSLNAVLPVDASLLYMFCYSFLSK